MTYPTLIIFGERCEPHRSGIQQGGTMLHERIRWVARVWPFLGVVQVSRSGEATSISWELCHDSEPDGASELGRKPFRSGRAETLERAVFDLEVEARTLWGNAQRVFGGR